MEMSPSWRRIAGATQVMSVPESIKPRAVQGAGIDRPAARKAAILGPSIPIIDVSLANESFSIRGPLIMYEQPPWTPRRTRTPPTPGCRPDAPGRVPHRPRAHPRRRPPLPVPLAAGGPPPPPPPRPPTPPPTPPPPPPPPTGPP